LLELCEMTPKMQAIRELAIKEMEKWGLRPPKWVFEFNNRKQTLGICQYPFPLRGIPGKIQLSRYYVEKNNQEEIMETVRHEIAHALAGCDAGHGPRWKQECLRVGAKPVRCGDGTAVMPPGKWQANCRGCQKTYHKHRRPKELAHYHCPKCGPGKGMLRFVHQYRGT
jgi:predicted SprT family Zn-dependent metalloprotease